MCSPQVAAGSPSASSTHATHGQVRHLPIGGCSVPVSLVGRRPHRHARTQHDHVVVGDDQADTVGAVQHLAGRVGVPGVARARSEMHRADAESGIGMVDDHVDVDVADEPVSFALAGGGCGLLLHQSWAPSGGSDGVLSPTPAETTRRQPSGRTSRASREPHRAEADRYRRHHPGRRVVRLGRVQRKQGRRRASGQVFRQVA